MRIAPEGWPFIATAWTLAVGGALVAARWGGLWWVMPALLTILAIWVVAFFRDPIRPGPRGDRYVLAAAEGKVLQVVEVDEPMYLKERAVRITVFLSVFDVHVNRSPVAGKVVDFFVADGGYAAAMKPAAEHNATAYTVLDTPRGTVVVAQRTGLIARRIVQRAPVGALLAKGERFGLIRFGSRTDVYLPADATRAQIAPGDRVLGGTTIIATWR